MKTFKQFQEQIKTGGTIKKPTVIMPDGKELPGLGGGGGGTNAITAKAKTKTFKNRVKDVGKILTFPISRRNIKPDPTEKFATEGVAALAVKGGSKLIPALMTGIGAAGTILQAKRSQDTKASRGRRSENKPKRKLSRMQQKMIDLENKRGERVTNIDPNKGITRKRETFNNPTNLSKPEDEFHTNEFEPDKSMTEEAPTNSMGGGAIAGSVEAGDNPPVKKKKKTYAYGGRGSRKMWMNNK